MRATFWTVRYFVRYFRYVPICILRASNLMRTMTPNDRWVSLPAIVVRYVLVHNGPKSLRWATETNDKTTAANQHLEQSTPA